MSQVLEAPEVARLKASSRNESLDFIKGILVLGMVMFHSVNYFAAQFNQFLVYLRFVSGGFVLLSGYIVGSFYSRKWAVNPEEASMRLMGRGLRLIVLFTLINLGVGLVGIRNHNGTLFDVSQFTDYLYEIYVLGQGRLVAFEILLPIGYTLVLAPAFLYLQRWPSTAWILLAGMVGFSLFETWHLGNPTLTLLGILGMSLGNLLRPEVITAGNHLRLSTVALVGCIILLRPLLRDTLFGYLLYTVVIFKFLIDACQCWTRALLVKQVVVRFGVNALFCYLVHIALLQILLRTVWPMRRSDVEVLILIAAGVTGAMWGLTALFDFLKGKSDRVYRSAKFVFG